MKYTVLLLLPDWYVGDQCCAADTVDRIWVDADTVEEADSRAARRSAVERLERWNDDETEEEFESRLADFEKQLATLAIYEGHLFDQHIC